MSESTDKISGFLDGPAEEVSEAIVGSVVYAIMELTAEVKKLRQAVEADTFACTNRTPEKIKKQMDAAREVTTVTNGGKLI